MNRLILSKIEELKYKINDDYTNTTSDTNNNATKTYNTISNVTQEVTTIKNKIGVLSDMFTDLRVLNGTAKNIINLSTVPIVENNGIKISNDKLLEDIAFLNIKKRMLIMIINELEKLDFIKKPRNQNRRMLLRFTNKAVEYFKS